MSEFAANLRKFRKKKGYSQNELSQKIHYGHSTIANYENGRNEPSFDDLLKLAQILDVSIDELLGALPINDETQLLSHFKKLDSKSRHILLELAEYLSSLQ